MPEIRIRDGLLHIRFDGAPAIVVLRPEQLKSARNERRALIFHGLEIVRNDGERGSLRMSNDDATAWASLLGAWSDAPQVRTTLFRAATQLVEHGAHIEGEPPRSPTMGDIERPAPALQDAIEWRTYARNMHAVLTAALDVEAKKEPARQHPEHAELVGPAPTLTLLWHLVDAQDAVARHAKLVEEWSARVLLLQQTASDARTLQELLATPELLELSSRTRFGLTTSPPIHDELGKLQSWSRRIGAVVIATRRLLDARRAWLALVREMSADLATIGVVARDPVSSTEEIHNAEHVESAAAAYERGLRGWQECRHDLSEQADHERRIEALRSQLSDLDLAPPPAKPSRELDASGAAVLLSRHLPQTRLEQSRLQQIHRERAENEGAASRSGELASLLRPRPVFQRATPSESAVAAWITASQQWRAHAEAVAEANEARAQLVTVYNPELTQLVTEHITALPKEGSPDDLRAWSRVALSFVNASKAYERTRTLLDQLRNGVPAPLGHPIIHLPTPDASRAPSLSEATQQLAQLNEEVPKWKGIVTTAHSTAGLILRAAPLFTLLGEDPKDPQAPAYRALTALIPGGTTPREVALALKAADKKLELVIAELVAEVKESKRDDDLRSAANALNEGPALGPAPEFETVADIVRDIQAWKSLRQNWRTELKNRGKAAELLSTRGQLATQLFALDPTLRGRLAIEPFPALPEQEQWLAATRAENKALDELIGDLSTNTKHLEVLTREAAPSSWARRTAHDATPQSLPELANATRSYNKILDRGITRWRAAKNSWTALEAELASLRTALESVGATTDTLSRPQPPELVFQEPLSTSSLENLTEQTRVIDRCAEEIARIRKDIERAGVPAPPHDRALIASPPQLPAGEFDPAALLALSRELRARMRAWLEYRNALIPKLEQRTKANHTLVALHSEGHDPVRVLTALFQWPAPIDDYQGHLAAVGEWTDSVREVMTIIDGVAAVHASITATKGETRLPEGYALAAHPVFTPREPSLDAIRAENDAFLASARVWIEHARAANACAPIIAGFHKEMTTTPVKAVAEALAAGLDALRQAVQSPSPESIAKLKATTYEWSTVQGHLKAIHQQAAENRIAAETIAQVPAHLVPPGPTIESLAIKLPPLAQTRQAFTRASAKWRKDIEKLAYILRLRTALLAHEKQDPADAAFNGYVAKNLAWPSNPLPSPQALTAYQQKLQDANRAKSILDKLADVRRALAESETPLAVHAEPATPQPPTEGELTLWMKALEDLLARSNRAAQLAHRAHDLACEEETLSLRGYAYGYKTPLPIPAEATSHGLTADALNEIEKQISTGESRLQAINANIAEAEQSLARIETIRGDAGTLEITELPWNFPPEELTAIVQSLIEQADFQTIRGLDNALQSLAAQAIPSRKAHVVTAETRRDLLAKCEELARRHSSPIEWTDRIREVAQRPPLNVTRIVASVHGLTELESALTKLDQVFHKATIAGNYLDQTVKTLEAAHPQPAWLDESRANLEAMNQPGLERSLINLAKAHAGLLREEVRRIDKHQQNAREFAKSLAALAQEGLAPHITQPLAQRASAQVSSFTQTQEPLEGLQAWVNARIGLETSLTRVAQLLSHELRYFEQQVERAAKIPLSEKTQIRLGLTEAARAFERHDFLHGHLLRQRALHHMNRAIFPSDINRNLVYEFARQIEQEKRDATRGSAYE